MCSAVKLLMGRGGVAAEARPGLSRGWRQPRVGVRSPGTRVTSVGFAYRGFPVMFTGSTQPSEALGFLRFINLSSFWRVRDCQNGKLMLRNEFFFLRKLS